jgi:acetyl esterase/lipase
VETFESFGPDSRLVGVLTGATTGEQAILVLPNAGLVPRAGPFRVHVEIAQRLAARGIRTFRFDLPGAGESPHLAGIDARSATQAALDHLATRGIATRFVVGGVCSAADRGWIAAVDDPRVVGVVLLDGVAFKGPWFQFSRVASLLGRPREWMAFVRRRIASSRGGGDEAASLITAAYRDWPTRAEAHAQLAAMIARNVRLFFVYTHGVAEYLRDPRQLVWSFGAAFKDPRVTCHYWRDCDHTFYARFVRTRLLDALEAWFVGAFGAGKEPHDTPT